VVAALAVIVSALTIVVAIVVAVAITIMVATLTVVVCTLIIIVVFIHTRDVVGIGGIARFRVFEILYDDRAVLVLGRLDQRRAKSKTTKDDCYSQIDVFI
jgi:hypothetical protein